MIGGMSVADFNRMIALERRVAALEEMVAGSPRRGASAPADDPLISGVVEALRAGQSIRGAARMLNLDRNKVARLRRRALAEGRLTMAETVET